MKFINNIFEKIFKKNKEIKVIEEAKTMEVKQEDKLTFIDSIKIKTQNQKEVRTLTCIGDGLGIQKKIKS